MTVCLVLATVAVQAGEYDKYYNNLPTKVVAVADVTIPSRSVSITAFGAVGDGQTLCTDAFRQAIDKLVAQGGGRVDVPDGFWLTGPIELKSNIELHLSQNAIVYFSPNKQIYLDADASAKRVRPCLSAESCKNIAITGSGIFDGNGQQWRPVKRSKVSNVEWRQYTDTGGEVVDNGQLWYPWKQKNRYPDISDTPKGQEQMRNDLLRFEKCENVLLKGVTFQNAPRFHVHPCYCRNVIVDGITVRCPWNAQNGDGIDLSDCHQAIIVNSTVNVGDDGICMKSGSQKKNWDVWGCQDILIQDNTVYHAHGGFVLGSETIGGVRDLVVRGNRFLGTDVGLRFKSALGRGGKTERMFIENIMMADISGEAISFQCDYVNRAAGDAVNAVTFTEEERRLAPHFQDIHISRVVCHGAKVGIKAAGINGLDCVSGITISDCHIIYNKVASQINSETAQLQLNNVTLKSIADH